jgi:hypothetical protein
VLALTFDDGPFDDRTPELLGLLGALGVPATFFLVGARVDRSPRVAREVVQHGHLVANHAYRHVDLTRLGGEAVARELVAARAAIARATGVLTRYARPPFSARDAAVRGAMTATGHQLIHWSVSANDSAADARTIEARVLDGLAPGSIVLLHELDQTLRALPRIVETARARGYRFVTLDGRRAARSQLQSWPAVIESATPDHTAGLVLGLVHEAEHVVICDRDDLPNLPVAVWAAGSLRAALAITRGGRLTAPMRMQLERLGPRRALTVGSVGRADHRLGELVPEVEELRPDEHIGPVDGPTVSLPPTATALTQLVAAASAARIGGRFELRGERDAIGPDRVTLTAIDPAGVALELAGRFPSHVPPVLVPARVDVAVAAALATASIYGAPVLLAGSGRPRRTRALTVVAA